MYIPSREGAEVPLFFGKASIKLIASEGGRRWDDSMEGG